MGRYVIGEPFNPWREKCGFFPPAVVGRLKNLGDGPKRAYERLVLYAGQNGTCYPAIDTLADELGKSRSQVIRDLKALQDFKLLDVKKRDGRKSNTYLFLWHCCFEVPHMEPQTDSGEEFEVSSVQPQTDFEVPHLQPQNSGRSSTSEDLKFHICKFEVPHMTPKRFRKDSGKIQSSSIEESTGLETGTNSTTNEKSENPKPDSGDWRKNPELIEQLRNGLAVIRFPEPSREDRLLGRAPASGNPARVLPDMAITEKILNGFTDASEVECYLSDLQIRDLPTIVSFGFFAADVRNIWPQRRADAMERKRREQRDAQLIEHTRMEGERYRAKMLAAGKIEIDGEWYASEEHHRLTQESNRAEPCKRCQKSGVFKIEPDQFHSDYAWCNCIHMQARKAGEPGRIETLNSWMADMRERATARAKQPGVAA